MSDYHDCWCWGVKGHLVGHAPTGVFFFHFVASVRLTKGVKEKKERQVILGAEEMRMRRDVEKRRRGGQMDGQIEGVYGCALKINYRPTLRFPFLFSSLTPASAHTAALGAPKNIPLAIPLKLREIYNGLGSGCPFMLGWRYSKSISRWRLENSSAWQWRAQ